MNGWMCDIVAWQAGLEREKKNGRASQVLQVDLLNFLELFKRFQARWVSPVRFIILVHRPSEIDE